MEIDDLVSKLAEAPDLRAFARFLGIACLNNQAEIEFEGPAKDSDLRANALRAAMEVGAIAWGPDGTFQSDKADPVVETIGRMSSTPALATQTLLEGITRSALRSYFSATGKIEAFQTGDPMPLPVRMLPFSASPHPETTHDQSFLRGTGFIVWDIPVPVELDYRYRDALDDFWWRDEKLPRVSSIHANEVDELHLVFTGTGFFPATPNPDRIDAAVNTLRDLRRAVGELENADPSDRLAAVLPEFCGTKPIELQSELASAPASFPNLVVGGSTHEHVGTQRRNTARAYLEGALLLEHTKRHPYIYRNRDGIKLVEDITAVQEPLRFASGSAIRFGLVICSDLNNSGMIALLNAACVNVLLCPSWSKQPGTFSGALGSLASYSQCFGNVTNVRANEAFTSLTVVPRDGAGALPHRPDSVGSGGISVGVWDPNEPSDAQSHWTWLASE